VNSKQDDLVDAIVKGLIFEVALRAVVARLILVVPFLGWPVINPVFVFILSKIAGLLFDEMAKVVSFGIIELQVDHQRKTYEESVDKLKLALTAGDPDAIKQAKEEFKNRLGDLIRLPV
jgi:hypothetical protein